MGWFDSPIEGVLKLLPESKRDEASNLAQSALQYLQFNSASKLQKEAFAAVVVCSWVDTWSEEERWEISPMKQEDLRNRYRKWHEMMGSSLQTMYAMNVKKS